MTGSAPTRRTLPWQAVVAATVLALLAAGGVLVVMGGDDGDDAGDTSEAPEVTLRPSDEVATGDPVDIELTDVDGETSTIRDALDGRPMVVNFFQSYCTPCVKEMPAFEAVHQDVGDRVDFLGIAVNDRPEDASEIVESTGITYDWTRDPYGDALDATRSTVMPTTMLVTPAGEIAVLETGELEEDELRELLLTHFGVDARPTDGGEDAGE